MIWANRFRCPIRKEHFSLGHHVQTVCGARSDGYRGLFLRIENDQHVRLTTHHSTVPRCDNSPLYSTKVWKRVKLYLQSLDFLMAWCLDNNLQLLVHIYYHIDNHIKNMYIIFHVVANKFPLYFIQYSAHKRIFQITYAHLNAVYITHRKRNCYNFFGRK
jgi:hypothetical protein